MTFGPDALRTAQLNSPEAAVAEDDEPLKQIVIDESDFIQAAALKIGQRLRNLVVLREFIDRDVSPNKDLRRPLR